MSNAVCPARRLTEADAAQVCALMQGNPQSLAFWTKNGFTLTGEVHPNDFSAYLPMERSI